MNMTDLESEIKVLIVNALDLEDVKPEDIETDAPLFGEGLGLDSIDALELGMALKKKYKIDFKSQTEENRAHFSSVSTLAKFVAASAEC
ncbi:MAG: phosphopantetheine-binding protein [Holophagaceae bacterium]|nr:phosphopantetheine-binding protein [Holophagaceae bacterium]